VRNKVLFCLLFIFTVTTDQASKLAVDSFFHIHDSRNIIGNFLRLTYIKNPGAAFGINFGNPKVMLAVTILVTVMLLYMFLSGKLNPGTMIGRASMVMILGGAVGNLIDRIRMGEVIDFIDMGFGRYRWPVYNLADVYVTVGVIILMITLVFFSESSNEVDN
jgi:signal peptidase II